MSAKNRFRKRKWKQFMFVEFNRLIEQNYSLYSRFIKMRSLPWLIRFYLSKKSIL